MMEYLVVFLPLLAALFSGLLIKFRESLFLQFVNSIAVSSSAICSIILFFSIEEAKTIELFPWVIAGNFHSYFSIHIDPLVLLMFIVVTIVSAVVHFYSIGYMHEDPHKSRFFCYLSLFTFAMLVLVSSADFLQLFLGWEGVGLCSYLLIGFWFKKEEANLASVKAFIINRIGDFSFLIGIFVIYSIFGTIKFTEVFAKVDQYVSVEILGMNAILLICFLLFIGAMSKSAQIGLHTWLPDAMEGPTPVSALIHAATMVTAGVFLVVKTSILFEHALLARNFILLIGGLTAIFAASIALYQEDLKKIIAYSTCSQLGYMFVACGLSGYNIAMFHLATHAFFKALLFLCAGNIIHSLNGEQNIYKMGGLAKKIPSTYWLMLIGSLALCGIFPFAGFYSKDLIIEAASVNSWFFIITVITALLTALYSFKIIFTVFHGRENFPLAKFHSLSKSMIIPLFFLAVPSIAAGYIGIQYLNILDPAFWAGSNIAIKKLPELHGIKHFTAILFSAFGIIFSYLTIISFRESPRLKLVSHIMVLGLATVSLLISFPLAIAIIDGYLLNLFLARLVSIVLKNKYYFDELYNFLLIKNMKRLSNFFWRIIDIKIIDFLPNSLAGLVNLSASRVIGLQTGYIYHYALLMVLGFLLIIFAL